MSNKNAVLNWSYDRLTEAGSYLVNYGDVPTWQNTDFFEFKLFDGELISTDEEPIHLSEINSSYQFARLCIGAEAQEMEG